MRALSVPQLLHAFAPGVGSRTTAREHASFTIGSTTASIAAEFGRAAFRCDGGTRKKVKTAAGNALREIQKALQAANAGSADGDAEE